MRRWRDGTGGKRKKRKSAAAAPVARSATIEHRTLTFEVGQITEPTDRPVIRNGSRLARYGRINHPASANRLAIGSHSIVDLRAHIQRRKTKAE